MNETTENAETRDYIVEGMTCSHCVLSVRAEVSKVPGVSAVEVDLPSGSVTVSGCDLDDQAVRVAVTRAGYNLAA